MFFWNINTVLLYVILFQIPAQSFCLTIPLPLNSHCLINVVSSNIQQSHTIVNTELDKWTHSFMYHSVEFLNLRFKQEELQLSVNLNQKHLKVSSKKKSSYCIIFFLFPKNFEDTILAIQNSGFGSSDSTLFFVYLSNHNLKSVVSGFDYLIYQPNIPEVFHASIIFTETDSKDLFLYCYFCPNDRFHKYSIDSSLNQIENQLSQLNGQGYGMISQIKFPYSHINFPNMGTQCFNNFKSYKSGLQSLKNAINSCSEVEMLVASPMQSVLNFSIVLINNNVNDMEKRAQRWFFNIILGESILQNIPLEILNTQGHVYFSGCDISGNVIGCTLLHGQDTIDYSFLSAVEYSVWILLVLLAIVYAFVKSSLHHGLDVILPLFGVSCQLTHGRLLIGIPLMSMALLSCSYQSYISVDLMIFPEVPSFEQLISAGYKIGFPKYMQIVIPLFPYLISKQEVKLVEDRLGGKDLGEFFVANIDVEQVQRDGLVKCLESFVKNKILLSLLLDRVCEANFNDFIGNQAMVIGNRFLCKRHNALDFIHLSIKISLRIWGYMSKRFLKLVMVWEEIGFLAKLKNLYARTKLDGKTEAFQYGSNSASKILQGINFWSMIGMSSLFIFCLGVSLLLVHFVPDVVQNIYAKIRKAIINMWQNNP